MRNYLFAGQGVVCVRSPWSDRVFAKALYENGYMSRNGTLLPFPLRTLLGFVWRMMRTCVSYDRQRNAAISVIKVSCTY